MSDTNLDQVTHDDSLVGELTTKFTSVFGQPSKIITEVTENVARSHAADGSSVLTSVKDGALALCDLLSSVGACSSIDDALSSPIFQKLKERFAFFDTIDVFEISQEKFNELVEGVGE